MVIRFLKKQWFMVGLVLVFAGVILEPTGILARAGTIFKALNGPSVAIFVIFFLSGMVIETGQITAGIRDIRSTLTALVLIFVFAPAWALLLCRLPLETGALLGICIVAVMPTTLSSGVVMTGTAGGNMAHALFINILSNFISIASIPLVLPLLLKGLGQSADLSINQRAIFFKLVFLVLIPLVLGMAATAKGRKLSPDVEKKMSVVNQGLILCIVFMSVGAAKPVFLTMGGHLAGIFILVSVFHLMMLGAAAGLIRILGIPRGRFESVLIMGAQKTMPLSVMIQITYFSQYGGALLVCVLHHFMHLMVDGYICQKLKAKV